VAVAPYSQTTAWRETPEEQRVFTRVPFAHPVRWIGVNGDSGPATLRNVSRSGVSVSLGRFLRPGPVVRLVFDDIEYAGQPIEVQALTVWCKPENGSPDRFVAGFKIIQGERHTLGAMSEVFYAAIREYAATHQF